MAEKDPDQRIVITGLGAVSSVGPNAQETYEAMLRGERGIRDEREWLEAETPTAYYLPDPDNPKSKGNLKSYLAARVQEAELWSNQAFAEIDERFIERYLSRSAVLAWAAAAEALRYSGVTEKVEPARKAFVVGTGIGGGIEVARLRILMEKGLKLPPTSMSKAQPDNATIMAAKEHVARGPSVTVTAACASGNVAIAAACRRLYLGEADVIVAGGTEGLESTIIASFERTRAANIDNSDPSLASRPFHREPGNAVLSEGAGFLVLENETHAKKRGATIYGEVAGYGETNDAYDPTMLSGEGIVRAMVIALRKAGISGNDRLYVSAHATATTKGDEAERDAILQVFSGENEYHLGQIKGRVSSIKGYTGHSVGAVNAIQAVIATKMLGEGKLPPAVWLPPGEILSGMEELVPPHDRVTNAEIDAVLSNGMGFGGQNSSIVIKKYKEAA